MSSILEHDNNKLTINIHFFYMYITEYNIEEYMGAIVII